METDRPPLTSRLNSRTVYIFGLVLAVLVWLVFTETIGGSEFVTGLLGDLGFYGGKNHLDKRLKVGGR